MPYFCSFMPVFIAKFIDPQMTCQVWLLATAMTDVSPRIYSGSRRMRYKRRPSPQPSPRSSLARRGRRRRRLRLAFRIVAHVGDSTVNKFGARSWRYPEGRQARFMSLELIFNPARAAASLLIWNRILVPSRMKLIMPPVSVNRSISPTVSTLAPLTL
jgi:hypothetical protein